MKLLLAILFAGCTSASHHAEVARVAHVAVREAAFQSQRPESDPVVRRFAAEYLNASAVLTWEEIPLPDGLLDEGVGKAIQGALPPNVSQKERIRILDDAQALLTSGVRSEQPATHR